MKQLSLAILVVAVCPALLFGAGSVTGKVTFTGTPAKQKPIDMSKEPSCAKAYTTPPTTESVVSSGGNGLGNVVVYVSAGANDESTVPSQAVSFDQHNCRYVPHVIVLHTNQELKVINSDQTSHNIHPLAKINHEWNKSQPPGTPPFSEKFEKEEMISVKCNVHPWMRGYFAVLKTNHYAISKDDGSFTLPDLPAGKYTLTAWHESYGTGTAEVSISGNESKKVDFTLTAKPY
jgi:hypothetical protein